MFWVMFMCFIVGGMGGNFREKFIKMVIVGKYGGFESFGVWIDGGVFKFDDFLKLIEILDGRIGFF